MKDVFADRAQAEFWKLMKEFITSLSDTFPDCRECKDWHLWLDNVIMPDDNMKKKGITNWVNNLSLPLVKGCAKYAKAVLSITESSPCVVHAVCYHDANAAHTSCKWVSGFNFPEKLQTMSDDEKSIFWQYFEELNMNAFKAVRRQFPVVPTSAQIAENISQRKGAKNTTHAASSSANSLNQGISDGWKQLLVRRECSLVPCDDSVQKRLKETCDSEFVGKLKSQDATVMSTFLTVFPEIGEEPLLKDDVDIILSMANFIIMDASIPTDMMKGIESMASKLVDGIASGEMTLADLNVESIGQQVLEGVSQTDINQFAGNIDKIMPALGGLQQ
jgi:hypothetical protein